jgi:hypothetical protein
MVRSKSSVKYYAKQIKHIIMRKDVVYLGMIWCNDIMSLNTSDEGYNDGKKCGKKGAICGPNIPPSSRCCMSSGNSLRIRVSILALTV